MAFGLRSSLAFGSAFHECVRYDAQTVTNTIGGQWDAPNAVNTHDLTVPNEPGGGILVHAE